MSATTEKGADTSTDDDATSVGVAVFRAILSDAALVTDLMALTPAASPTSDDDGGDTDGSDLFSILRAEIGWSEMFHRGGAVPRLVCMQGAVTEHLFGGEEKWTNEPLYRHPADEQPLMSTWTPTVARIRDRVNEVLSNRSGREVAVNHALIQLYRGGNDYISEHADKTIDVLRGSDIVSVSFGATRQFVLRPKRNNSAAGGAAAAAAAATRPGDGGDGGEGAATATKEKAADETKPRAPRPKTRVDLPDDSMVILGWETNKNYLHAIRKDKRQLSLKRHDELIHDGERISLTFRTIDTFCARKIEDGGGGVAKAKATSHSGYQYVWGQGARSKTSKEAREAMWYSTRSAAEAEVEDEQLLYAFHNETSNAAFDWDANYGRGFH